VGRAVSQLLLLKVEHCRGGQGSGESRQTSRRAGQLVRQGWKQTRGQSGNTPVRHAGRQGSHVCYGC
jgi:hypothetical protein